MPTNFLPLAATGLQPVQEEYPRADRWLRRLCLAILTDVLKDLEGLGGSGGRIAIARARYGHEAWEWVRSDAWYFFSFRVVCTVLDLNIAAVRRAVRRRLAQGDAALSDVSRGLGQPLARALSARAVQRTRARSSLRQRRDKPAIARPRTAREVSLVPKS
jgi:hypothetical protein